MTAIEKVVGKENFEQHVSNNDALGIMDKLCCYRTEKEKKELIDLIEKKASLGCLKSEEKFDEQEKLTELLNNTKKRQPDLDKVLSSYVKNKETFEENYGTKSKNYISQIEVIIGKDKVHEYYNNNNIHGIIYELTKYLPEDEAKEFIDSLEKEDSI